MSSHLGGYLGAPEAFLELWGTFGGLRALLGLFWGILGPSWGSLGGLGVLLGLFWGVLGPSWGPLGALLGLSWGPLGGYGAPPGAILEAIDQKRGVRFLASSLRALEIAS